MIRGRIAYREDPGDNVDGHYKLAVAIVRLALRDAAIDPDSYASVRERRKAEFLRSEAQAWIEDVLAQADATHS